MDNVPHMLAQGVKQKPSTREPRYVLTATRTPTEHENPHTTTTNKSMPAAPATTVSSML